MGTTSRSGHPELRSARTTSAAKEPDDRARNKDLRENILHLVSNLKKRPEAKASLASQKVYLWKSKAELVDSDETLSDLDPSDL